MPAGMSIVPGEPSPTRATCSVVPPACSIASRTACAHASGAVLGARSGVGANAQPGERSAQVVDHADLDVRAAQIDADEQRRRAW